MSQPKAYMEPRCYPHIYDMIFDQLEPQDWMPMRSVCQDFRDRFLKGGKMMGIVISQGKSVIAPRQFPRYQTCWKTVEGTRPSMKREVMPPFMQHTETLEWVVGRKTGLATHAEAAEIRAAMPNLQTLIVMILFPHHPKKEIVSLPPADTLILHDAARRFSPAVYHARKTVVYVIADCPHHAKLNLPFKKPAMLEKIVIHVLDTQWESYDDPAKPFNERNQICQLVVWASRHRIPTTIVRNAWSRASTTKNGKTYQAWYKDAIRGSHSKFRKELLLEVLTDKEYEARVGKKQRLTETYRSIRVQQHEEWELPYPTTNWWDKDYIEPFDFDREWERALERARDEDSDDDMPFPGLEMIRCGALGDDRPYRNDGIQYSFGGGDYFDYDDDESFDDGEYPEGEYGENEDDWEDEDESGQ